MTTVPPPDPRPELRRRSKRMRLRVPVLARTQSGGMQKENTNTLVVNAHGALLILAMKVSVNQLLLLTNPATGEEVLARVTVVGPSLMGKSQVGVEFIMPTPDFWGLAGAPKDWSTDKCVVQAAKEEKATSKR